MSKILWIKVSRAMFGVQGQRNKRGRKPKSPVLALLFTGELKQGPFPL
jgi:hypothetical protein